MDALRMKTPPWDIQGIECAVWELEKPLSSSTGKNLLRWFLVEVRTQKYLDT